MVGDDNGGWKGASVSRWPFERLRASGTRLPPVHPSRASGRTEYGPPRFHPSAGSGQALREPQGERNTVPPGSPFGRLRAGPSRASGRAEHGSPRFTFGAGSGQALRFPSGRTERGSPGSPFEAQALRASGSRFPPVHPSGGSGQALREAQGRPFERLRANGEPMWRRRDGLRARDWRGWCDGCDIFSRLA